MNEELKKRAYELVEDFNNLDIYQEFLKYKSYLENDEELNKIKKQRDTLQKDLKYLHGDKKKEALKLAQELNDQYNSSPLVINYLALKKELEELLYSYTNFEF